MSELFWVVPRMAGKSPLVDHSLNFIKTKEDKMNKLEYSLDEFVSDVPLPERVVDALKLFVKYVETKDKETLVDLNNKAQVFNEAEKLLWANVNRFVKQFSDDNRNGISDQSMAWNIILKEWDLLSYFSEQRLKKDVA